MKYEILMSTMNKKSISELQLEKKNIYENCLVINQITDENIELEHEILEKNNIRMLSFKERGLSKSRNRGLENCKAELIIITDDDVKFKKNIFREIQRIFEEQQSDILTFKFEKVTKDKSKKYKNYSYNHNKQTLRKVSSVEIVANIKKIREKKIKFDERFGLGSIYNSGEENIFLIDCLKNNLKIKFYPKVILEHPDDSSRDSFDEKKMYGKGAIFKRMYGKFGIVYLILFCFFKYKFIRKELGILKALKSSLKGYISL